MHAFFCSWPLSICFVSGIYQRFQYSKNNNQWLWQFDQTKNQFIAGWARVSGNLQLSLTASKLVSTNCFSVATRWCICLHWPYLMHSQYTFFFVKVLIIEYVFLLICLKIFRYFVPAICCICVWIYLYLWWQTGRRDWCIRPVWPAELHTLWIRSQIPHCTAFDRDRMRRGVMVIRLGHPHHVEYGWVG